MRRLGKYTTALGLALASVGASAAPYLWTDWQGGDLDPGPGFQAQGTITSGMSSVTVTYTNSNGIAFYQNGTAGNTTDFFAQGPFGGGGRNAATSPYTSAQVDNIPPAAEMIALQFAGTQTLTFSEAIANPVFAFVSLNFNGYAFDQDFEILSLGGVDGNDCGYWGCGNAVKVVAGPEFQLNSNNVNGTEPHGTIRFLGTFDTLTWRSSSNEFWNGFTVGTLGRAVDVCVTNPTLPGCPPVNGVPAPAVFALLGLGLAGLVLARRRTN